MAAVSIKPATEEETEAFVQQNKRWLPDDAEQVFRSMSAVDQRRVISAGTMSSVRDPAAVIQARVRKAKEMEAKIGGGQGASENPSPAQSQGTSDGRNSKPASREDVEAFIKANERWLQGEAEEILRNMNASDQKRVLAAGTLSGCRDPVAVIQTRAKKARDMEAELEGLTKQAPPPPPPEPPPPPAPTFCEAAASLHMFAPAEIVSRAASKFAPPPSVQIKEDVAPMVGEERGVGGVIEVLKPKYGFAKGQRLKVIGETGNLLQFEGGKTAPKNHENTGWKWILRVEEDVRIAAAKAAEEAEETEEKGDLGKKRSDKKRKTAASSSSSASSSASSSSSSEAKKKKPKAVKTTVRGADKVKVTKSSSSSSGSSDESNKEEKVQANGVLKKTSLVDGALGIAQRLLLEAQQKVAREAAIAEKVADATSEAPPELVSNGSVVAKAKSNSSSSSSSSSDAEQKETQTEQMDAAVSKGDTDAGPLVAAPVSSSVVEATKDKREMEAEEQKSSSSSSSSSSEALGEAKNVNDQDKEDVKDNLDTKESETIATREEDRGEASIESAPEDKDDNLKKVGQEKGKKRKESSSSSSEPKRKKDSKKKGVKGEKKKTIHRSSSSTDDKSDRRKRSRGEKAKQKEKRKSKDRKAREKSRSKDKRKEKSRSRDAKTRSKRKAKREKSSSTERRDKSRSRKAKEKTKGKAKRKSDSSSSSSGSS